MFEFEYKISEEDFILFNQYHMEHSVVGKGSLLAFKLAVPFGCLVIFFVTKFDTLDPVLILINAVSLSIVSVIWMIFSKKMLFSLLRRDIQKSKADGRLPYCTEGLLIFDDEQMQDITSCSVLKTKYSSIEKVGITEKAIYIYINSAQACMLATSAFSSEDEKQKFLRFINSKI